MTNSPLSPSLSPLLDRAEQHIDTSMEQMDTNRLTDPDNSNPEGTAQTSFPTYGSVQADEQQAPPLEEKVKKKKKRGGSVVSLSSFGDVS